jgi:phage-related protein
MTTLTFPTLPTPQFPISAQNEDPTITTPFENGMEQTRPRFTKLRKSWTLKWNSMLNADRDTLAAFWILAFGGSTEFTWTNPYDSQTYTVRFSGQIRETWINDRAWQIEISLKQI